MSVPTEKDLLELIAVLRDGIEQGDITPAVDAALSGVITAFLARPVPERSLVIHRGIGSGWSTWVTGSGPKPGIEPAVFLSTHPDLIAFLASGGTFVERETAHLERRNLDEDGEDVRGWLSSDFEEPGASVLHAIETEFESKFGASSAPFPESPLSYGLQAAAGLRVVKTISRRVRVVEDDSGREYLHTLAFDRWW